MGCGMPGATHTWTCFSGRDTSNRALPSGPLPDVHHQLPQCLIDSSLVPSPLLLEPRHYVRIQTERYGGLEWLVKLLKFRRQVLRGSFLSPRLHGAHASFLRNSFTLFHLRSESSLIVHTILPVQRSTWNVSHDSHPKRMNHLPTMSHHKHCQPDCNQVLGDGDRKIRNSKTLDQAHPRLVSRKRADHRTDCAE